MYKKNFLLIILFYILLLIQNNFNIPINLILISVIIICLFEKQDNLQKSLFLPAIIGGFFLDIFSEHFIGFWILILIALTIFIKLIFKKYVKFPSLKKF